jgi:Fe-Mn family superoxide dismutase
MSNPLPYTPKPLPYTPKQFHLSGLNGISDQTLEMHFKLYEGYVKETNRLTERIHEFFADGQVDQEEMPAYSELTRRLGFEYNGMVLHEYYFGNLKRGGSSTPNHASAFYQAAEASFGRYELWRADFIGVGKMRGVGWAICYQDPVRKHLSNHWVTLHEIGNVAGFTPILVMTSGNTRSCSTIRLRNGPSTSRPSSRTSIGRRSRSACRRVQQRVLSVPEKLF